MRLIEKSLTESIYNALNESSNRDKATKRVARYRKSNRARMNESDKYCVSFSSGELNMDLPFNNDKIKRKVIKGKGGKGPDGVETDLVKYIGTKEDLEKLMDKDFDGEYKNSIKKLDESEDAARDLGIEHGSAEEAQLNSLYDEKKIEWTDLSGSDQTAVEHFLSRFGKDFTGKSWNDVESDIREACHEIGYANEELIDNGYWNDGDMDPEPDEKKVTEYIFQNYFLPKKNSKNMNESAETGKMTLKDYAMNYFDGDIDMDVTDTEIDMLVAFVNDFNEEPKDNYDRFLNLLGERTKVVKVGNNVLTCDFSSVFKPYEDKLQDFFDMDYSDFNEAYYEAVSNLEALISGNAGEKTYKELLDILTSKQINESANIDVNNLTKEQLWKLRQEIVLGSLYTHDYDNSFGIDPSAVCSFFDSFIEDAHVDDFGRPNDRETEDYDNAEDLYDYYCSCENPFGEIENMNESASYEGYTDKEIIKDVIDNFKKITGKEVKDVLNYDKAVEGFFKQSEVESTGESIINYLTKKGLSRSHVDELLYKLDDELTSLWNKL